MERQFFSGNTIEQAVMAAARHYGLDPSRVAYNIRDKKHGFLNKRRRVVIEVDPSTPEKVAEEAPPQPVSPPSTPPPSAPPPPAPPESLSPEEAPEAPVSTGLPAVRRAESSREPNSRSMDSQAGESADSPRGFPGEAESLREELLEEFAAETEESDKEERELIAFEIALDETIALMDADIEGTVEKAEDLFDIEITGPDSDLLMDEDGRLLRAIEHLLPRLVRGLLGYGLPCSVDCEGFRSDRESELRELAGGMAELVRRQGTPQKLDPMNPADRRIVHMALADDSTVRTESEGEGYMKRVEILPA